MPTNTLSSQEPRDFSHEGFKVDVIVYILIGAYLLIANSDRSSATLNNPDYNRNCYLSYCEKVRGSVVEGSLAGQSKNR